ncbi:Proteasomal ubiquitin receptor ADRM1 [Trichinella sp. T8]|nr:Proteasomal ubiquitin receptor ADRM1 [Trichinella sp. T8]
MDLFEQSRHRVVIEFFAGKMNLIGNRLYPDKRLGVCYIHLAHDNFFHFCWKDRKTGIIEDNRFLTFCYDILYQTSIMDILIFPGLGRFSKYIKRSQNTAIEEEVNEFFNFYTLKFTNFTAEDLFMIYGMDPPENLSKSPIYLECEPNKELEDSDSVDSDESFMQMLEQIRKVFAYMENQLSSEKFHVQFTEGSPPMLKLKKRNNQSVTKKESLKEDYSDYEADDEDTTTKMSKSTNKPKDGKTNSSKEKDKNSGNSKTENQKSNSKLDEQPKKKDDESKDMNNATQ